MKRKVEMQGGDLRLSANPTSSLLIIFDVNV